MFNMSTNEELKNVSPTFGNAVLYEVPTYLALNLN